MRVGVLTGGGDCPGLNAVIRAIVRKGVPEYGYSFLGFRDGWRGPLEAATMPLDIPAVRGLLPRGGTILGSSRTNPFAIEDGDSPIAGLTEIETVADAGVVSAEAALIAARNVQNDTISVIPEIMIMGDTLKPRWPQPVKVPRKGGLRKLAEKSRAKAGKP